VQNVSSKFQMNMLNELKNRGVQNILITRGTLRASHMPFHLASTTEIHICIIHHVRNSTNYVSYKDLKKMTAVLKLIYVDDIGHHVPTYRAILA